MKKIELMVKNEKGSAILIAVMVLVIVTIIGIESSNTSTMEVQISAAERSAKINFYKAEGAAMEGSQEIEDAAPSDLIDREQVWLHEKEEIDLNDEDTFEYDGGGDDTAQPSKLDDDGKTYFIAADEGIPQGGSLHMTHSSQLHKFRVIGGCEDAGQSVLIEMGYRRRY